MRFYSVRVGDDFRLAVKEGAGTFIDLQKAYEHALLHARECESPAAARLLAQTLIPQELAALLDMGRKGMEACETAVRFAREAGAEAGRAAGAEAPWLLAEEAVKVGPPIRAPRKFLCIGVNYAEHAQESNHTPPEEPLFFNKFATSIVGPYDDVVHQGPPVTEKLDYEVELGVVIGRRAKNVSEEEAPEVVFGYTVINDVSARDLQKRDGQWVKGKALDTYAPLGPCVVTKDEIDAGNLVLRTRVNGELRQESTTANLIFSVPRLVAFLSRLMTLEPGDIISTGTPSGVGGAMQPPKFLQPGDIVECEVEGIGTLRNRIVSG